MMWKEVERLYFFFGGGIEDLIEINKRQKHTTHIQNTQIT